MLGPAIHLSALTGPADVELAGASSASAELRRRAEVFTNPFAEYPTGQVA